MDIFFERTVDDLRGEDLNRECISEEDRGEELIPSFEFGMISAGTCRQLEGC